MYKPTEKPTNNHVQQLVETGVLHFLAALLVITVFTTLIGLDQIGCVVVLCFFVTTRPVDCIEHYLQRVVILRWYVVPI